MVATIAVALESLPGAREIVRELGSHPEPHVYLIRGRSGTGKSTLLAAIRQRLRDNGIQGRIVDDAHTLPAAELEKLRATVESATETVVIATRPSPHCPALRALADAVSRRGRVVELRALGAADIAPFARELGMMVPRTVAQHIHRQTAGIHGGVVAALSAACAARLDAGIEAVDAAVTAWARRLLDDTDPELLEAFVVAGTGTGLDPGELTEVLGVEPEAAVHLIDRARASALVTDADLLLAPAVAPLRTLVGDRRYLAVQRRLLQARLDAELLRDHTALLLAESGVRDPRLAEFLCAAARRAGDEAVRYYAAAAASGSDPDDVALGWAEAAARSGDGDTALRLAEPILARPDATPAELTAAVRICAGVWTRRGLTARAAQLYTWLGPQRVGPDWAIGATVLYLAGETDQARSLSTSAPHWPPTEATARAELIATALSRSLTSNAAPEPDTGTNTSEPRTETTTSEPEHTVEDPPRPSDVLAAGIHPVAGDPGQKHAGTTNEHAGLTRENDAGTTSGNHAETTSGIHTGTTSDTHTETTGGTYTRTTGGTHAETVGGNHTETTSGTRTGMTRRNDTELTSGTHARTTSDTSTEWTSGPHTEITSGTHAGRTRGNDAEMASGTHSGRTSGPSADVFSAGALNTETSAGTAMSEMTARTTTSETNTLATAPETNTRATTSTTGTWATTSETSARVSTSATDTRATEPETSTRATTPGRGTRATISATGTYATTPEAGTQATTSTTGTWAATSEASTQTATSATDTRATAPGRGTRATTSATATQATTPETSMQATTSATGTWAAASEAGARVSTSAADTWTSETGTRATTSATSTQATTSETGRTAATAAAAALIQAARTETADRFLPVTPVSLAALLCLSMGEPRRALDALRGGPSVAVRANGSSAGGHLLVLSAWVAMLGGDEQEAAACVGAVHQDALFTRDRLLAHGVAVGLARRSGDHSALTLAWQAAAPLFDDVGVDLLTLLPIGELWLAGIRLRDEGRIAGLVDAARELLRRLHNPPAWANAFHWYALQAAIAHERPDELLSPARQLKAAAAAGDPHAAVLADAGRTWVLVLRGQVEPEEVSAAVRRLAGIGLSWDAARLASEAALAAGDSATATVLLKLARTVRAEARPSPRAARPADPAEPAPPKPAPVVDAVLSEREREVAELVLLGLTYREIGARLYISSKTVEHHVARIRRRIGAGSRSELLSMLRAMGHGSLLV